MFKKIDKNLFSAILYIVVGAMLIIFKSATLGFAMTIVGALFCLSGVLDVIKKNYPGGAVSLIIGISIITLGWLVAEIVLIVLGVLIAVKGVVSLLEMLKNKKVNIVEIVFASLTVITGIMLAFGGLLDVLFVIAGALLIVDGAIGLLPALKK